MEKKLKTHLEGKENDVLKRFLFVFQWKRISCNCLSLFGKKLLVKKCNNLYLGLVMPSCGRHCPIAAMLKNNKL